MAIDICFTNYKDEKQRATIEVFGRRGVSHSLAKNFPSVLVSPALLEEFHLFKCFAPGCQLGSSILPQDGGLYSAFAPFVGK